MHIKKALVLVLSAAILLTGGACTKQKVPAYQPANPNEEFVLDVYAPAEMMGVLSDIVYRYSTHAPRASVRITWDDGAILAAKIEAGYACDIYIADEQRFMDWLDQECGEEENPNRNDKIVSSTRCVLAEGPGNEAYRQEEKELEEDEVYITTYSAAVCRTTALPYEAEQFILYMLSEDVQDIYEPYGFSRITEPKVEE